MTIGDNAVTCGVVTGQEACVFQRFTEAENDAGLSRGWFRCSPWYAVGSHVWAWFRR